MAGRRFVGWAALLVMVGLSGCCSWCERHCPRQTVAQVQPCVPVCCPVVCCPAPGPAGYLPAPSNYQPTGGWSNPNPQANCCK